VTVRISGDSDVSFENVALVSEVGGDLNSSIVRCEANGGAPRVSIKGGEISGCIGRGLVATGCSVELDSVLVRNNREGGIEIRNSDYSIVNSFIATNGSQTATGSDVGGIAVFNTLANSERFEFNTVAGNLVNGNTAFASGFHGSNVGLEARSNIIHTLGQGGGIGVVFAGGASFEYSLIEGDEPFPGEGNIIGNPELVAPFAGDLHLKEESPCIDAADPEATLDHDVDGEPRPAGDAPDMGADEVQ
jgi:hypothetical protein